MPSVLPESWLKVTERGLYCEPGDFYVDPHRPVGRAVVTHGHADHARPGNRAVLATPETLAIMRRRYGAEAGETLEPLAHSERRDIGGFEVDFPTVGASPADCSCAA